MPINFEQKKDGDDKLLVVPGSEALDTKKPDELEKVVIGIKDAINLKEDIMPENFSVAVLEKADAIGVNIEKTLAEVPEVTKQGAIKVVEAGDTPDDLKKADDAKLNLTTQLKRSEEEAKDALAKEIEGIRGNVNLTNNEKDREIKTARRISKAEVKDIKNQPEPFDFSKPVAEVAPAPVAKENVPPAPVKEVVKEKTPDEKLADERVAKINEIAGFKNLKEAAVLVQKNLGVPPEEVEAAVTDLLKKTGHDWVWLSDHFKTNTEEASKKKSTSPDPVLDHQSPILGGNPDRNLPGYGRPKARKDSAENPPVIVPPQKFEKTNKPNTVPEKLKSALGGFGNPPQQPPQGPKTPEVPPPPEGTPKGRRSERVEDTTPVEKLNWYDKFLIKKAGVNERLEATLGGYTDSVVGKIKDWLPISKFGVAFNQFFADHYDKKAFKVASKVKDIEMGIAKIRGQIEADEMVSRGGKLSKDEAFSLAQRKRDAQRAIAVEENKKDRLSTKVSTLNNIKQEWIGARRDVVAGMVEKLNDRVHPCEDQLSRLETEKNEFDKEVTSFQSKIETRKNQLRSIEMDIALNPGPAEGDDSALVASRLEELRGQIIKDQNKLFEIKEERKTLEHRIVVASDLINQRKDRSAAFERLNISGFMHSHQNRAYRPEASSKIANTTFDTPTQNNPPPRPDNSAFFAPESNSGEGNTENVVETEKLRTTTDLVDAWNWSDKTGKKENNKGLLELDPKRIAKLLDVDINKPISLGDFRKAVLADNKSRKQLRATNPAIKVASDNLLGVKLDAFIENLQK